MKKRLIALSMSIVIVASMSMTSFAGQWQQDTTGWWYQNDDGTYFNNGWEWIDSDGDGLAECYYFDANGYMLANTTTPDAYTVNESGAWVVNGVVQIQGITMNTGNNAGAETGYNSYGISNAAIDMLDSTKEENAAKYGVVDEYEMSGDIYVKYANGLEVLYWKGNPDEVLSNTPSKILKGIDNSIRKGAEAETDLKANGYTDTYNDGPNAVTKVNGYQITWTVGIPLMRITKIKYYN